MTPCSSVSVVNFELLNAGWELKYSLNLYWKWRIWRHVNLDDAVFAEIVVEIWNHEKIGLTFKNANVSKCFSTMINFEKYGKATSLSMWPKVLYSLLLIKCAWLILKSMARLFPWVCDAKLYSPSRHEMSLRDLNQISIDRDISKTS